MQSVGTKDTSPEVAVRRLLHALGYRFRLHRKDLPGRPDIVFPSRRKAIFVHGCFWHGHLCSKGRLPKSRLDYWGPKIARNRQRDAQAAEKLRQAGWSSFAVWQCELREQASLSRRLIQFLGKPGKNRSTC
ncbi:MAG: very short patch repair endonuclease [Vicinamibacterales bacterium]